MRLFYKLNGLPLPMTKHSTLLFIYEQYPYSKRFFIENPRDLFAKIDAELVRLLGNKKPMPTPSESCINKILAFAKEAK